MATTIHSGKIKFYNEQKGYGFIIEDGTTNEYFVHATGLLNKIKKEDAVEFDLVDSKRGQKAVNVKRVKSINP